MNTRGDDPTDKPFFIRHTPAPEDRWAGLRAKVELLKTQTLDAEKPEATGTDDSELLIPYDRPAVLDVNTVLTGGASKNSGVSNVGKPVSPASQKNPGSRIDSPLKVPGTPGARHQSSHGARGPRHGL